MKLRIAIDGPSGSGKSTLAKRLAKRLSLTYVDTGALYRTVGLFAQRNGVKVDCAADVVPMLSGADVTIRYEDGEQKVFLNGEDVSSLIRTPEISMYASAVSAVPAVREFLLELQKKAVREGNVIMDGRDIGTVIMPDADVKLFVVTSPEARAHRRYLELTEKGIECNEADVLADIIERDHNDSTREISPAVAAPDAVILDNSLLDRDETEYAAVDIINEKLGTSF